jgi:hypothetical protein
MLPPGLRSDSPDIQIEIDHALADQQPTDPPQEPFVVRAPNGVVLGFGDVNAARKIDVDALAVDPVAEGRRVDPLPDSQTLIVGEMIDIVMLVKAARGGGQ